MKSDQNHVDKRILRDKGLQYEDSTSMTFVRPVRDGSGVASTLSGVYVDPVSLVSMQHLGRNALAMGTALIWKL